MTKSSQPSMAGQQLKLLKKLIPISVARLVALQRKANSQPVLTTCQLILSNYVIYIPLHEIGIKSVPYLSGDREVVTKLETKRKVELPIRIGKSSVAKESAKCRDSIFVSIVI